MNANMFVRMAGGALLAGSLGAALAADITLIQPSANNVTLDGGKALVRFNVNGTAASQDRCGYFVDYSDNAAGDSRILEKESGPFSRPHERTFSRPGTYTVKVSGKWVKTTAACNGSTSTTINVAAAAVPAKAATRAPLNAADFACPEGWMLNEKSVNRSTGAYNCGPKPAVQMTCAEGLRYFERDGVIGCSRSGRRN